MRGRVAGVLLWCATTVAATVLVQGGVGTIRAATRATTVVDVQAVTVDVPGASGPATTTTGATPSTSTTGAVTTAAPTTAPTTGRTAVPPITGGTGTPPPTGAPPPPTAAPPTAAPPTAPPPTAAPPTTVSSVTRTITAQGGTVTVRYRPDEVTVVAAVPNAGYAVEVDRSSPTRVRVEFEDGDARSRIELWWDTEARHEVRED